MSEAGANKGLRERLTSGTEDRLGRALTDLLENSMLHGAIGRASDAREKAAQAQELAMGALNLPSAADVERLTRRLRSVSQRLESIEDGVHRLGRTFPGQSIDSRLGAIEEQLKGLSKALGELRGGSAAGGVKASGSSATGNAAKPAANRAPAKARPAAKAKSAKGAGSKAPKGAGSKAPKGAGSKAPKGAGSKAPKGAGSN